MTTTKRAVIYCRVSTKEQVEEGNSLVTQEKHCREYAHKQEYEIAAVFVEQGESAKTADRTELRKLMSFCAVRNNNVQAIIAYKIDRISRNIDDYSQIRIQLKRYGVEIKSTTENFEDNPAGRFMENIIANVAQFDNDVRAERSIGGMKDAVREGRYVWLAPYGYSNTRVNGKATIAPNDFAIVINQVFKEIAANKYPIDEVRRGVINRGLLLLNGKQVSKSCFYRLIRNELYTGWICKFGERHKGKFEAIVSEDLFWKVQAIISPKNKLSRKHTTMHPDFPLRRFFRHPSGRLMTGCWARGKSKKYPYYMIHKEGINIRKEMLEDSFKQLLNTTFKMDIGYFEKLYAYVKSTLEERISDFKIDQNSLQEKIEKLKERQKSLVEKNISGIISDELFMACLSEMNTELYDLTNRLDNLPETNSDKESILRFVRSVFLSPGETWELASLEGKIKLQRFYFPDGIEISKEESRTLKVCRFFNLKQLFMPEFSQVVNHLNATSNTPYWQLPLTLPKNIANKSLSDITDEILSVEGREELVDLATILNHIAY